MARPIEVIVEPIYGDNEHNLDTIEEALKIFLQKCEEYVLASQAS